MDRFSKTYKTKWQNRYSDEFKRHVCNDFLTGTLTRRQVEHKYGIGNSRLTYWLQAYGFEYNKMHSVPLTIMPDQSHSSNKDAESIKRLKKELEDAKLLAEAYRTIIEKAEKELKIPIRKKFNTK